MFTRNFTRIMCARMFGFNANSDTSQGTGTVCKVIAANASERLISLGSGQDIILYNSATPATLNVTPVDTISYNSIGGRLITCLGSGTTEPTIDDYDLESRYPNFVSRQGSNINLRMIADSQVFSVTTIFTNTHEEDIVVNEIGIYTLSNITSATNPACLIWREVLETPVTIKGGKSKSITVNLDFSKING